jgi:hypothetical protein
MDTVLSGEKRWAAGACRRRHRYLRSVASRNVRKGRNVLKSRSKSLGPDSVNSKLKTPNPKLRAPRA